MFVKVRLCHPWSSPGGLSPGRLGRNTELIGSVPLEAGFQRQRHYPEAFLPTLPVEMLQV